MENDRWLTYSGKIAPLMVAAAAAVAGVLGGLPPAGVAALVVGLTAVVTIAGLASADRRSSTAAPAPEAPDLVPTLHRELERSRRQEQPLSVARLPLVDSGVAGSAGAYLAKSVQASLRTIDETLVDGGSLYLVLPGTDRVHAQLCVERLAATRPTLFADADIRIGTFPDDGVTVAGILLVLDGAAPAASPEDLPKIDRRRRITVDLTTKTSVVREVDA